MGKLYSFRTFLKEEESPEPTAPKNQDYFAALGDEEGIEWKDLVKTLESEPWISSHFSLGSPDKKVLYKLSPWEIVKGSLSPNGADIRLKQQRGSRSYLNNNRLNKSSYEDRRRYHLNREELAKFLTTGWSPAVQAASGGGAPLS
jgi:hypothetical protein